MPDFDFDAYNHDEVDGEGEEMGAEVRAEVSSEAAPSSVNAASSTEEVDKW